MPHERIATIQRLWDAFNRGGVPAVLELAEPDVEWMPHSAGGDVLRGSDELRRWSGESWEAGQRLEAHVYAYELRGDCVVVSGYLRIANPERLEQRPMHWRYTFDGDRLRRAEAFTSREQALALLAAS